MACSPAGVEERLSWTARDFGIIEALALKVRVLTLAQIADAWWGATARSRFNARRRLNQLIDAGLLERYAADAQPLIPIEQPVFAWTPGAPPPDCEAVAWSLQSRWRGLPPSKPTNVYVASPLAANLFAGNGGGLKHFFAVTHDLHLGAVFLAYLRDRPGEAARWRGEDAFEKAGYKIKDPDAFLLGEAGRSVERAIEFGGAYDAKRVAAFHKHCWERSLPYELW